MKTVKPTYKIAILATALGSILAIGSLALLLSRHDPPDTTVPTSSREEQPAPFQYRAQSHGFVVDLPQEPTVQHVPVESEGVEVDNVYYIAKVPGGNSSYAVQITDYPAAVDFDGFEREALANGIKGVASTDDITLVSSSNEQTFLGYPAANAVYRYMIMGWPYETRSFLFMKDNSLYTLIAVDTDKQAFGEFVESFAFQEGEGSANSSSRIAR